MNTPDRSSNSDSNARLPVAEALTIYTVAALASEWRGRLQLAGPFVIELGTVVACDTLGIQLLWATKRAANEGGKALQVTAIPSVVAAAATAAAADSLFASNSA
jgi:anti-anti-sigma regulatory factor